jgi:hypothetical protein
MNERLTSILDRMFREHTVTPITDATDHLHTTRSSRRESFHIIRRCVFPEPPLLELVAHFEPCLTVGMACRSHKKEGMWKEVEGQEMGTIVTIVGSHKWYAMMI